MSVSGRPKIRFRQHQTLAGRPKAHCFSLYRSSPWPGLTRPSSWRALARPMNLLARQTPRRWVGGSGPPMVSGRGDFHQSKRVFRSARPDPFRA